MTLASRQYAQKGICTKGRRKDPPKESATQYTDMCEPREDDCCQACGSPNYDGRICMTCETTYAGPGLIGWAAIALVIAVFAFLIAASAWTPDESDVFLH